MHPFFKEKGTYGDVYAGGGEANAAEEREGGAIGVVKVEEVLELDVGNGANEVFVV